MKNFLAILLTLAVPVFAEINLGPSTTFSSLTSFGCIKTGQTGDVFNANCTAGKVGIGTVLPLGILDVQVGGAAQTPRNPGISIQNGAANSTVGLNLITGTAGVGEISFNPTAGNRGAINHENSALSFITNGSTNVVMTAAGGMTVAGPTFTVGTSTLVVTGGKVGIGTTNPGHTLTLASINSSALFNTTGASGTLSTDAITYAGSYQPPLATVSSDYDALGPVFISNRATSSGVTMSVLKTRASRPNTDADTVVASGDNILTLKGGGADGTLFRDAASIAMDVDATPGASDMPGRITFNTTPDGSATLAERMRITNSGSVGIGTTNPLTRLSVLAGGTQQIGMGPTSDYANYNLLTLDGNMVGATATGLLTGNNVNDSTMTVQALGGILFRTVVGGSPVGRMMIANGGNVGIGEASPSQKLDISAGGILLDMDRPIMWGDGSVRIGGYDNNDLKILTGGHDHGIYYGTGDFAFGVNRTDTSTITASGEWRGGGTGNNWYNGNVGIGTTAPIATLNVVNSSAATHTDFVVNTTTLVVTGGNVGIGTANPAALLEVAQEGTALSQPTLYVHDHGASPSAGKTALAVQSRGVGATTYIATFKSNDGTTNVMHMTEEGKVGIGITNPITLLHLLDSAVTTTKMQLGDTTHPSCEMRGVSGGGCAECFVAPVTFVYTCTTDADCVCDGS